MGLEVETLSVAGRFAPSGLSRVSLTAPTGSVTAVSGPPGSGKTLLLRVIAGLVAATSGTAKLDGVPVGNLPAGSIGLATDPPGTPRGESIEAGLARHCRMLGHGKASSGLVTDMIGRTGLAPWAAKAATNAPHDVARRAGLATALLGSPALLLLDEPFAGQAPASFPALRELLRIEAARGATVVITARTVQVAAFASDQLVYLAAGTVGFAGDMADLDARMRPRWVLGCPEPAALARELARSGRPDVHLLPSERGLIALDARPSDSAEQFVQLAASLSLPLPLVDLEFPNVDRALAPSGPRPSHGVR